ncbi:condensation domain-containing protein [Streptomyces sp. NRRL S-1022]|uniref:condensation domain-containing protein n=1 Tax=Streptomyces sp. NRRL S-1022 TaxID=1463880 RepID=UPI00099D9957|nr:condensation domain-containing protein [Streptomyces sp. NRRL S-1022]
MPRDLYVLPASPGQEWMWLIHHMLRDASPYVIAGMVRIRGPVDPGALGRSLDLLVERHEALRTVFRMDPSGELSQVVRQAEPVDLARCGLDGTDTPRDQVPELLRELAARPFDLSRGPLLRASLTRLGPQDHVLALAVHHIVSDGWSMRLMTSELAEAYRRLTAGHVPDLPEPPLQYADFAVWHREWLTSQAAHEHLAYWRRQLDGASPLRLPLDPAPPAAGPAPTAPLRLGPATTVALTETARRHGASLFMLLLTAYAATLARFTGQRDFVVTVPVAGRSREELTRTVGLFVNTLPIRVDASGNPTLLELLRRVRLTCLEAYDHQELPYERMVREAAWQRDRDNSRLGPAMFALRVPLLAPRRLTGDTTVEVLEPPPAAGGMDLLAELAETPGEGLHGYVAGRTGTFHPDTVRLLAGSLTTVLTIAATGGGVPLEELPVTVGAARRRSVRGGTP